MMFEYLNAVTENIRENSCGLFNYRGVGDYVDYPVLALANRVFKREFQAAKSFSASAFFSASKRTVKLVVLTTAMIHLL